MDIHIKKPLALTNPLSSRNVDFFPPSANSGEQLQEEKDAKDFDAEKGNEPLNPKQDEVPPVATSTPDKKPETKEEDEKKSNGAHTPV